MGIPGALVQELAEPGMRCTSVALLGDGRMDILVPSRTVFVGI